MGYGATPWVGWVWVGSGWVDGVFLFLAINEWVCLGR